MIDCYLCGHLYDPTRHRWRCPTCGIKDNCCDGEACQPADARMNP